MAALGLFTNLILWGLIVQLLSQWTPVIAEFSPQAAFQQLLIGLRSGVLIRHTSASLLRVGVGLVIAVCIAVPLGLLLGLNRRLELTTSAVFPFIPMISPLSWMPNLLASVRVAVGLIWVVLVPAEMLGVSSGLGYLILDCRDRLAYGELTAVLPRIGAIGWGLDSGLRSLSRDDNS